MRRKRAVPASTSAAAGGRHRLSEVYEMQRERCHTGRVSNLWGPETRSFGTPHPRSRHGRRSSCRSMMSGAAISSSPAGTCPKRKASRVAANAPSRPIARAGAVGALAVEPVQNRPHRSPLAARLRHASARPLPTPADFRSRALSRFHQKATLGAILGAATGRSSSRGDGAIGGLRAVDPGGE
jgi:hypothetical protein